MLRRVRGLKSFRVLTAVSARRELGFNAWPDPSEGHCATQFTEPWYAIRGLLLMYATRKIEGCQCALKAASAVAHVKYMTCIRAHFADELDPKSLVDDDTVGFRQTEVLRTMTTPYLRRAIMVGSLSLIVLGLLSRGWGQDADDLAPAPASPDANDPAADIPRVSVDAARRQAEILHTAIHSTLQVVHHRYYREDEGLPIVAATLREVFAELESEENVTLRWLAVEGQVMNTDHRAQNDFETNAVEALKSGAAAYELVEDGFYRRVGAITLTNQCLKCHVPDRTTTEDRTAGLMISVPILSVE